jgi:ATP-dependent Clp protease ATP-binding subunit ClpC
LYSELKSGEIVVVDVADPGSEHPFTFTGTPRSAAPDVPPVEFGGIVEGFNESPEAANE